jgi:hypothetical protein
MSNTFQVRKAFRRVSVRAKTLVFKMDFDPELWFVGIEFRPDIKAVFIYPVPMVQLSVMWGLD